MPRESQEVFNTFLDDQRRKLGLTHAQMWKALQWSKQRYWGHQKSGCIYNLKELGVLAKLRGVKVKTIANEFIKFYFAEAVEDRLAS